MIQMAVKVKGRRGFNMRGREDLEDGLASVLCSWEVVKAEVRLSVNQSLLPSGSPSKRKLNAFPKERAPTSSSSTPSFLLDCLGCYRLLSIPFQTTWRAKSRLEC